MPPDLMRLVPEHRAIVESLRQMFPDESDESLADTIEGQSSLPDAIFATLRAALVREAMAKGLGDMIDQMVARKRRIEEGAKSLRNLTLRVIQEAEGLSLPMRAPDMTVSIGRGKPKVQIVEPDLIPAELCRIIREPSKTAIAAALADGREVPGATLGNSIPFLTVHRS